MSFGRVDVGEQVLFHAPVGHRSRRQDLDVAALLHRAAGLPFAFDADHVGFSDLRVQVADEYRSGRGFLAGDAAHAHLRTVASARARRSGVPLTVVRDTLAGGREAYGSRLVLVRPDQFVAWTGDTAPDEVGAVVTRVAGRT